MKKKYLWLVFLFFDWLSAASAWFCFNFFRKTYIENYHFELNYKLIYSTIIISVLWVLLYAALGQYKNAYKNKATNYFFCSNYNHIYFLYSFYFNRVSQKHCNFINRNFYDFWFMGVARSDW